MRRPRFGVNQGTDVVAASIRFAEVRAWLFDRALPLWSTAGLDHMNGGAVEALDFSGRDAALPFKRTRVQARQVYAFTHAELLGWDGGAAADHCWAFLATHGRRDDGAWVRNLGREGGVHDGAADAYDMAFVLLALAWRARAGRPGARSEAHATFDALDRLLRIAPGLGWRAAEDNPILSLNPHMHLLEATVELAEACADERAADIALDILDLFADRLFDRGLGVLPEDFEAGWAPVVGAKSRLWPGHHYEWAWILHRARDVLGVDHTAQAKALYDFAEKTVDPLTRLTDDALTGDELRPSRTFRSWPQTEALKGQLVMFEHHGLDTRARIAEITNQLLDHYLAVDLAGGWQDQFDGHMKPLAPNIPTSILYHLMLAFTELLRLEHRLSAAD